MSHETTCEITLSITAEGPFPLNLQYPMKFTSTWVRRTNPTLSTDLPTAQNPMSTIGEFTILLPSDTSTYREGYRLSESTGSTNSGVPVTSHMFALLPLVEDQTIPKIWRTTAGGSTVRLTAYRLARPRRITT